MYKRCIDLEMFYPFIEWCNNKEIVVNDLTKGNAKIVLNYFIYEWYNKKPYTKLEKEDKKVDILTKKKEELVKKFDLNEVLKEDNKEEDKITIKETIRIEQDDMVLTVDENGVNWENVNSCDDVIDMFLETIPEDIHKDFKSVLDELSYKNLEELHDILNLFYKGQQAHLNDGDWKKYTKELYRKYGKEFNH